MVDTRHLKCRERKLVPVRIRPAAEQINVSHVLSCGVFEVVVQVPFRILFPERGIQNGIRYYVASPG